MDASNDLAIQLSRNKTLILPTAKGQTCKLVIEEEHRFIQCDGQKGKIEVISL